MDPKVWLYIHLAGVLGLLGSHGASMTVLFKLRKERDRERIETFLQLSGSAVVPLYVSIALLLIGGIGGLFAGSPAYSLSQVWIWGALVTLVASLVVMWAIATPYYKRVREALAVRPSGVPRVSDEELDTLLRSGKSTVIAVVGFAALALILWMMIAKPGFGV